MKKEVIYLSYDGLMEAIGISQIYKYLVSLETEYKINIISYEKKNDYININKINQIDKVFKLKNISWFRLKYHKYPYLLSSIYDLILGLTLTTYIILKNKNVKMIHIRGYFPGIIIFPLLFTKIKILFDMRGFWADEKADRTKLNRNSIIYKFLIFVEKILLQKSKKIICLTNESIKILINKYPKIDKSKYKVIPTCVDTEDFKFIEKKKININKIIFAYVGSVDTAYDITKILNFFSNILVYFPQSELRIFTKQINTMRTKLLDYPSIISHIHISHIQHKLLSYELSKCDIGIFYLNKNYSIKASFPTKIGEFLSCGLPIICNNFNKDIQDIILSNNLGFIYNFEKLNFKIVSENIKKLLSDNQYRIRCRSYVKSNISLKIGLKLLKEVYDGI